MPTTTLIDPAVDWRAWALQARTDADGEEVDDSTGEDARLLLEMFSVGVVAPQSAYQAVENVPPAMNVVLGSGTAHTDIAIIQGTALGQGKYIVRLGDATTTITVPAADATNPRIDEIYLIVQDNQYDLTNRVLPRIGYRQGDASSSPAAPGPDSNWDAHLLITRINVNAAVTSIINADIVDQRPFVFPLRGHSAGEITMYGGTTAPTGALMCQGQPVSRSTFAALFGVLGTTYGAGDGVTTFNVPDLRQRFPLGRASSGTGSTLGSTGGAIDHVHSTPSHSHTNPSTSSTGNHSHTQGSTSATGGHSHGLSPGEALITLHDSEIKLRRKTVANWTFNRKSNDIGFIELTTNNNTATELRGNTTSVGNHSHTNPSTASAGNHSHTQGSTGSTSGGNTGSNNPPFLVVNYIVWT